jgi:hypothetical protein
MSNSIGLVRCCSGMPWSWISTNRLSAPEDVLEPSGGLDRPLLVASHQVLEHVAAEAASGGDDPLAVLLEDLPVDPGLVVVALHEGPAGELDQVLVAGLVLGQRGEVVVELLAALGVAAGVVDASAPARLLEPRVVRHVELVAQDRLDAVVLARLVEGQVPYMLPWSVMPMAGWPSAAAAATTSSTRAAPSSIEYSVCTCRWVNESPTGDLDCGSGWPSTAGPQGSSPVVDESHGCDS